MPQSRRANRASALPATTAPAAPVRPRPGRPLRGDDESELRTRILDVAEEHFAKHGYEAVSTRKIAAQTGATPAMIHYYFKTKRQLFDAVFSRRASIVNADRMAALSAYEASLTTGAHPTIEGPIHAFLHPVLTKLLSEDRGWRWYLELVAQVGNKHEWGGEVMTRYFDPVIERLVGLLAKALPDADERELYWGYHFLSGALLLTLSEADRIDRLSKGKCRSTDIEAIEPRLVAFAAAGFRRLCNPSEGGEKPAGRRR